MGKAVLAIFVGYVVDMVSSSLLGVLLTLGQVIPAVVGGQDWMAALMALGTQHNPYFDALGILLGTLCTALGGYVAVTIHDKHQLYVAVLSGSVSMLTSLPFLFGLLPGSTTFMIIGCVLAVPAAISGGTFRQHQLKNKPVEPEMDERPTPIARP